MWVLYLIRARGRVLYAGITTDLAARLCAHQAGRGAKFLRGRGPLRLVYSVELGAHGLALRAERRLKNLEKRAKEALVRAAPSRDELLAQLGLPEEAPAPPRRRPPQRGRSAASSGSSASEGCSPAGRSSVSTSPARVTAPLVRSSTKPPLAR